MVPVAVHFHWYILDPKLVAAIAVLPPSGYGVKTRAPAPVPVPRSLTASALTVITPAALVLTPNTY